DAIADSTRAVVRSHPGDELELLAALAAGAKGYVDSTATPAVVARVLSVAAAGGMALPRRAEAALAERVRALGKPLDVLVRGTRMRFTEREYEVLLLLRQERSLEEIAVRLLVAKATVRTHFTSLCRKFEVEDVDDLVTKIVPS